MKTNLISESDKIGNLAWKASEYASEYGTALADNFPRFRVVREFLDKAESAGYSFRELCVELNGYSVRNASDQIFQFCCSVSTNESES